MKILDAEYKANLPPEQKEEEEALKPAMAKLVEEGRKRKALQKWGKCKKDIPRQITELKSRKQ